MQTVQEFLEEKRSELVQQVVRQSGPDVTTETKDALLNAMAEAGGDVEKVKGHTPWYNNQDYVIFTDIDNIIKHCREIGLACVETSMKASVIVGLASGIKKGEGTFVKIDMEHLKQLTAEILDGDHDMRIFSLT